MNDYEKIINFVLKKMNLTHRHDELFDIGLIAFTNGINTFDESKGYQYMSYLYDCIKNAIMKQLDYEKRKRRKANVVSLNTLISDNTELQDMLGYEYDYEQNSYIIEMINIINKRIDDLTDNQQLIIKHLYGLDGYKELSAQEIAKKYKFSRNYVYLVKKRVINILRNALYQYKSYDNKYDNQDKKHINSI